MNLEKISIPDCTLDKPVKKSSGNISFCLLPCLHRGEKIQIRLPTRFKIYSHGQADQVSFSLGISLPENSLEFFKDLEKRLNLLALEKKDEVKEIGKNFARYQKGDFALLKVDKSEQEKIYAKIYPSKLPNQDFACRFWQLCTVSKGIKKKKSLPHPATLTNMPLRGQVVFSVKHLFCGNVKTITCIVDEVLVEEVVQAKSAFDDFDDRNEEDLEKKKKMRRWKIKSEKKSEKKNSLRFQFRSPRKEKSFSGEKDFSSIPSRETFQILHFETFSKIWRQNLWKIFFKKIFFLEEIFLKLFHLQFWKKVSKCKI